MVTTHRNGQFAKGNTGGPGNPHARQVAVIRSALLAALTPDVLQAIVARLVEQAVEGNMGAIKLLLGYAIGKPGKAEDAFAQLALPLQAFDLFADAAPEPEPVPPPAPIASAPPPAAPPVVAAPSAAPKPAVVPPPANRPAEPRRRHQTAFSARTLTAGLANGGKQSEEALDKAFEMLDLMKKVVDPAAAGVPSSAATGATVDVALIS